MTGFDAELYLRLSAEDTLLGGGEGDWDDTIVEQMRALIAVDAVDRNVAGRVITEYARANALRGRYPHMMHYWSGPAAGGGERPAVQPLAARRVVACDRRIDQPGGTLHVTSIVLATGETRLHVTMRSDSTGAAVPARHRARHSPHGHSGPQSIPIKDDRGVLVTTTFSSGGGSDFEFSGVYSVDAPLRRDTRWVEVLGERIELAEDDLAVSVDVEQLDAIDPARRYLHHRLLADSHGTDSLRSAIQALVACGALPPRSPVLDETLQIEEFRAQDYRGVRSDDLPQPWRSLGQHRRRPHGPVGALYFGAVTPVFDGVSVAVNGVRSDQDGFQVWLEAAGAASGHRYSLELDNPNLAFTAADDQGGHYLGHLGSYHGSDSHLSGDVEFTPPLNPRATRLEISVSTGRARAVFGVPLRWGPK